MRAFSYCALLFCVLFTAQTVRADDAPTVEVPIDRESSLSSMADEARVAMLALIHDPCEKGGCAYFASWPMSVMLYGYTDKYATASKMQVGVEIAYVPPTSEVEQGWMRISLTYISSVSFDLTSCIMTTVKLGDKNLDGSVDESVAVHRQLTMQESRRPFVKRVAYIAESVREETSSAVVNGQHTTPVSAAEALSIYRFALSAFTTGYRSGKFKIEPGKGKP